MSERPTVTACPSCGRSLPPAFPGASVSCAGCGRRVVLGARSREGARAEASPTGPYRRADTRAPTERESPCPYCGNACPPLVRICPHCDVRLDAVRCVRCYSLQGPGSATCARCGQALELEPLLDATEAPCPRCSKPLEVKASDDQRVHECGRCGGMFVPKEALAAILTRAESAGALPEHVPSRLPERHEVRYLPCPLCHASMNRKNFGRVSGIIVDVCRDHGTWFDGGELTRAVAFAAAGGLEKERDRAEYDELRVREAEARMRLESVRHTMEFEARISQWRRVLDFFLWW